MDQYIIFDIVLILCCAYAAVFGGKAGLWGALLFIVASQITTWVDWFPLPWANMFINLLIVDVLCMLLLFCIACKSDRYWPIWALGLQQITVLTHLASLLAPDIIPKVYIGLAQLWSLPILLIMVLGIGFDRYNENNINTVDNS